MAKFPREPSLSAVGTSCPRTPSYLWPAPRPSERHTPGLTITTRVNRRNDLTARDELLDVGRKIERDNPGKHFDTRGAEPNSTGLYTWHWDNIEVYAANQRAQQSSQRAPPRLVCSQRSSKPPSRKTKSPNPGHAPGRGNQENPAALQDLASASRVARIWVLGFFQISRSQADELLL